jgi:hypothetical protein
VVQILAQRPADLPKTFRGFPRSLQANSEREAFFRFYRGLWTATTNGHIVHAPDDISVWWTTVEWYRQGKIEEIREKPIPVPLCPPQITHGLTRAQTRDSAVRGERLNAWAMARPLNSTLKLGHELFLPNPFHFIIGLSPFHSMLYSIPYWKGAVK